MGDIDKAFKKIENAFKKLEVIEDGLKKMGNEINDAANDTGKALKKVEELPAVIEDTANFVFVEQIGGFFQKFIKGLEYGLVEPLEVFFVGLGKVFMGIFGILFLIIKKIISIPGCIIFYIIDAMSKLWKAILPSWIYYIISTMYYIFYYLIIYPMIWVLDLILVNIFGFKSILKMFSAGNCLKFPASKHVDKMSDAFKEIARVFSSQFGRIDKGF